MIHGYGLNAAEGDIFCSQDEFVWWKFGTLWELFAVLVLQRLLRRLEVLIHCWRIVLTGKNFWNLSTLECRVLVVCSLVISYEDTLLVLKYLRSV